MFIKLEDTNGQINYVNIANVSDINIVKDNVHGMGNTYSMITLSFINSINKCCMVVNSDNLKEYIDKIETAVQFYNVSKMYFEYDPKNI